jgi:hypothetical protein
MYDDLSGYNQVSFKWNSGSIPTYTNWAPNNPDQTQKCVSVHAKDNLNVPFYVGQWQVTSCSISNAYICEQTAQLMQQTTESMDPGCPSGFHKYEERCFKYVNKPLTWSEAQSNCQTLNADLVSINDKFEQAWLSFYQLSPTQVKWIGLSDNDIIGQYSWVNKDKVLFNNWDKNKPGNFNYYFYRKIHLNLIIINFERSI